MIITPENNIITFYPQPPEPTFDGELYLRNLQKDFAVEIDEVSGMQVIVLRDKRHSNNHCLSV